jgi:hypothetical protein
MRWQLDVLSFSEIDDCRGGCISGKIQIAQAPRLPLQLKGIRRGKCLYN